MFNWHEGVFIMEQREQIDIIKEFGLEKLSDDQQVAQQQKIMEILDTRFIRQLVLRLSDDSFFERLFKSKTKKLNTLLAGDDQQAVISFIAKNIPDYPKIYRNITDDLKREMSGVLNIIKKKD